MIVINKSNINQSLIFTLSEINSVITGSILYLFDVTTNKDYQYNLPADVSAYPTRFNQFNFVTTAFNSLSAGIYKYTVKDSTSAITETGLVKVVDDVQSSVEEVSSKYTYITPASIDDDYIVL